MRYSVRGNTMRIVFEASDDLIKNANTITSLSSVKIEFPSAVVIRKQQEFVFETAQRDRFFGISLKDVADVKTYKLYSPARIVIDLKTAAGAQKEFPTRPAAQTPPGVATPPPAEVSKKTAPAGIQALPQPSPALSSSSQAERPRKIRTVVIDPGHGGYEDGIGGGDMREKDIDLAIARDLSTALAKKGLIVHLTRKADQPVSLTERIVFASGKKPDLFLSLHASSGDSFAIYTATEDTGPDSTVKAYSISGRQTRHLARSRSFAKVLAASFRNELKTGTALRELPLPVLYSMDAPAVLIEYPSPATVTYDQKMRERVVRALVAGIAAYDE